jgi:hypothetical protein
MMFAARSGISRQRKSIIFASEPIRKDSGDMHVRFEQLGMQAIGEQLDRRY